MNRVAAKKKSRRTVPSAIVCVKATFNNTLISIADPSGNVIVSFSAGQANFSGSRKSSSYAASVAAKQAAETAHRDYGVREAEVWLKGPGGGRESAVRAIQAARISITKIEDRTAIPHNGCKPRKKRRV